MISRQWLHFLISQEAHHLGSRIAAICQSGKFPGGLSENRAFHSTIFHPIVNHDFPHEVCHVLDWNASMFGQFMWYCWWLYIPLCRILSHYSTSNLPIYIYIGIHCIHICTIYIYWSVSEPHVFGHIQIAHLDTKDSLHLPCLRLLDALMASPWRGRARWMIPAGHGKSRKIPSINGELRVPPF